MARIALLGATGNVGARLLAEALARGHQVTALIRDPARLAIRPGLKIIVGEVTAPDSAEGLQGHDVLISSLRFAAIPPQTLIAFAKRTGIARLLVVGGAASLRLPDGSRLFDSPEFPAEYHAEAGAGISTLEALQALAQPDWTFLSPSMNFGPATRTGTFRLGDDTLLFDANGDSHISYEDYAIALLDEVERPAHSRRRFTVGY